MTASSSASPTTVFISHQWKDKQLADRLARDLEDMADVWMDYRNLRPGDAIQPTIDAVLSKMDIVLVVWTANAAASGGVASEIETCIRLGVRIVPCIFKYREDGTPEPPLHDALQDRLGIDFHHYGSGVYQVADLIVHLQNERLPEDVRVDSSPAARMLHYLKGYLSYLANYRKVQGVADDRAEWVDKIIREVERYAASGGDRQRIRSLVEAARQSQVEDEEGIGMLISRLDGALGAGASETVERSGPPLSTNAPVRPWSPPPAPPRDELERRIDELVPPGTAGAWLQHVQAYIDSAPVALQALTSFAWSAQSPAGMQVVQYLQQYLSEADDLIPDHQGRYGLIDDAWLILNTTFRLVESGLLPAHVVPLDWQSLVSADAVVQALIPDDALNLLSNTVMELLQVLAEEVASYQPWFAPSGRGYAPAMAPRATSGGTWEDQMNSALLGTGLSVDG